MSGAHNETPPLPQFQTWPISNRRFRTNPQKRTPGLQLELHTHFYTQAYFDNVPESGGDFSFDQDPTVITQQVRAFLRHYSPDERRNLRLEAMDLVGIDVQVASLYTPNIVYTDSQRQPFVARMMNNSYADLVSKYPKRFKAFASVSMDNPNEALKELPMGELKLNGVILLRNIGAGALTSPQYRPFFAEANHMKLCIFLHLMLPVNTESHKDTWSGRYRLFDGPNARCRAHVLRRHAQGTFQTFGGSIGHIGGALPYLMERMDSGNRDVAECSFQIDELQSVYLKRIYYDTVTFSLHNLMMTRDLVGSDHMVRGSDFPHLLGLIDKAVSSIEALNIPVSEKRRIFEGTATSILNNV